MARLRTMTIVAVAISMMMATVVGTSSSGLYCMLVSSAVMLMTLMLSLTLVVFVVMFVARDYCCTDVAGMMSEVLMVIYTLTQ